MSTDTTERALRVLGLLQSRPGWTASELAADLDVTTRTVRRDIERLRQLGYAVEGERGSAGGYRLARGRAVPPLLFTEDEVVAVGLGLQRTAALSAGSDAEDALRALAKLDAALPGPLRERLRDLRSSVRVAGGPVLPSVGVELLTAIAGAVRSRRRISFDYPPTRSASETLGRRRVEPYQLVVSNYGWYLWGYDLDRDDWRLFRLDRVSSMAVSTFEYRLRSDAPDPVQQLGRIPATSYRHRVLIRIEAPLAAAGDWFGQYRRHLVAVGDATELRAGTDHAEQVPAWLAGLPWPYTVRGDEAVRAAFEAVGRRMLTALDQT